MRVEGNLKEIGLKVECMKKHDKKGRVQYFLDNGIGAARMRRYKVEKIQLDDIE